MSDLDRGEKDVTRSTTGTSRRVGRVPPWGLGVPVGPLLLSSFIRWGRVL